MFPACALVRIGLTTYTSFRYPPGYNQTVSSKYPPATLGALVCEPLKAA